MLHPEFGIRLKREAKTSLQVLKDQSLLRRRFGEDAARLYDLIVGAKTAQELMEALSMSEERFMEIMEFMNNNGMISVVQEKEPPSITGPAAKPPPKEPEGSWAGGAGGGAEGEGGSGAGGAEAEGAEEEHLPERGVPYGKSGKVLGEEGEQLLSPLERVLFDKYGEIGVKIYNLIDGEKTAEEILHETGVSEARLVEILEFMDEQGIIKLEKPPPPEPEEEEEQEEANEPAQEPRFKPMLEEEPEESPFVPPKAPEGKEKPREEKLKEEEAELENEIVMVDVPQMANLSLMQKALLFTELSTRFGKGARELIDLVDGKRDFVDLSLTSGMSFFEIDTIMAYFGKKGLISFRQLSREEIKKKYGDDGFAIYKRYGRDGLLLYEMIGKEASLKDIIVKSKLDPDRAIDILMFIHKVLGLDVPIDRNLIYRQLGMKK